MVHYYAVVESDREELLARFPDCPGCQTFDNTPAGLVAMAADALDGWLSATLTRGKVPPAPTHPDPSAMTLRVPVRPRLAVALQLRWMRSASGLTQTDLANRLGITQQAVAKLENPDANLQLDTLINAADALGAELEVNLRQRLTGAAPIGAA